jgi:hypothetical protein
MGAITKGWNEKGKSGKKGFEEASYEKSSEDFHRARVHRSRPC